MSAQIIDFPQQEAPPESVEPKLTPAQIEHIHRTAEDRDATIKAIRQALQKRSGKAWSVTGGRGTAWGWITIDAPPARRTWGCRLKAGALTTRPEDYEECDTGEPGRTMSPTDRAELGKLLGCDRPCHMQGESIPAGYDYRRVAICRAIHGHAGGFTAEQYWD